MDRSALLKSFRLQPNYLRNQTVFVLQLSICKNRNTALRANERLAFVPIPKPPPSPQKACRYYENYNLKKQKIFLEETVLFLVLLRYKGSMVFKNSYPGHLFQVQTSGG